ncbi:septin-9 isoform X1 [Toxotes jaculatrix]|uniref:septin-9 isoform X1 n=1 Tax=Toxotes jaculatrix TaxID=941984 RepID=UPI001B3AD9B2|nr:septin-9 isoform X1 [Toxotes jaculatrix]
MSELSVNDHLEGILSDFEALKRSFEIEDVEDIPSFSSPSPVSTPISPSSSHFFLNHNKANEERGGGGQSPSLAFNNNNNSLGSAAHRSCISLSSNPSPVLKSRTVVSSLSFNRGTMNKPAIHNNSSSVARAASFQSRLNPNSYSMLSGPGSDNDSLHSSTSSLDYSGGGALSLTKLGSYPSPTPQVEYHQTQPQLPQQHLEGGTNLGNNHSLKKFSSHGSVFHSEIDQGRGMMLGVPQPRGVNHGSMPSLDLQICDGGNVGMQRGGGGGGGRMSPGLRYANADANWNGHLHNATFFEEEGYGGSRYHSQQQGPQVLKAPQPKAKEIPRLNKFPLDLDSLVNSTAMTSPTKSQGGSMNPNPPKPPPRSMGGLQHLTSPQSTTASPSASLSSLDSSSDTPPLSLHHPYLSFSPRSPTPSQGSIPVPEMSCSPVILSPAQSPQLEILSGPQVVQMVPNVPSPHNSSSPSSPRGIRSLVHGEGDTRDSVGSILQRIASFSRPVVTDPAPTTVTKPPAVQSNGGLSSAFECPAEIMSMPSKKQGKKKQEETAGELETDPLTPMEERKEKESGIMGREQEDEGKSEEQPARMNTQNSITEKEENCAEVCAEMQEKGKEKGMGEGEMKKEMELEAEVKVELCQSVPGQQMSFIKGTDLFGYVGIEAVLDQMRRKTMKAGFEFNIMVVGQSGLGKSTLVNTLFKSKVSRKSCMPNYEQKISKTVKLHSVSHMIEEKGVKMKLTVIDTPGFGDQINNENCWDPIVKYVNEQYEKYLREELHVNRKRRIPDSRVHCCIYFLPATGHRLRPIDVEFMKRLGKIVSIVPVIAKADTLTIEERQEFKERIRQDLAANGIRVYPQKEYDEDPEDHILNDRIRESIPFAVVGTDKEHQVNGNKVLGRKTKWGIIEVENVAHCEFANLRDLLIRSHLQDLKDVTHNIHYETYRVQRLNECNVNFSELGLSVRPLENGTADKCESDSHL